CLLEGHGRGRRPAAGRGRDARAAGGDRGAEGEGGVSRSHSASPAGSGATATSRRKVSRGTTIGTEDGGAVGCALVRNVRGASTTCAIGTVRSPRFAAQSDWSRPRSLTGARS